MKYALILLFLCCLSCTTIVKTAMGVKKPRLETKLSVKKYLVENDVYTSDVYVFRNLKAFALASEYQFLSFPDAFFFNEKGELVHYPKTTENCNAQVGSFIDDLKGFSDWPSDQNVHMEAFTKLLDPDFNETQAAAISVFITFTTYSGKLNREKAFEWIALLEKAKQNNLSVKYYLVSADYMQSWNIPESLKKKWKIRG